MRLFGKINSAIDRFDRAMYLTPPFDRLFREIAASVCLLAAFDIARALSATLDGTRSISATFDNSVSLSATFDNSAALNATFDNTRSLSANWEDC